MEEQGCVKYNQQDMEVFKMGAHAKASQRENPFYEGTDNWKLWEKGWEHGKAD